MMMLLISKPVSPISINNISICKSSKKLSQNKMVLHGGVIYIFHTAIVQPNSLAAVSRKLIDNPLESRV